MNRSAVGAIAAQGAQAVASFALQILVAKTLGISALGAFAILYGVVVLASGTVTGFVGDSLVVLDRRARVIRSALEQYALLLAFAAGAIAAVATTLLGFTTPIEGVLFALAVAAFCLEEVVRRTLMADLRFWRVAAIDSMGLVVTLIVIGASALLGPLQLGSFLGALALGQTVALLAGFVVMPKADRFLVPFIGGGRRAVAAYGSWRSLQQFLRPALLTAVRSTVTVVAGLAATGLLEAARTYTAPALLLVSGLSSYLFASFARSRDVDVRARLRRADRAVLALLGLTAAIGVVAIVLLPLVGRALFSVQPDLRAVIGWLAYTASVAAVTPYGALAAVSGGQSKVFLIRASDTVLSLVAVVVGLLLGMDPAWSAALLAVGSLAGGLVLRYRTARTIRVARPRRTLLIGAVIAAAVVVLAVIGTVVVTGRSSDAHPAPAPDPSSTVRAVQLLGDGIAAEPGTDGRLWTDRLTHAPLLDVVSADGFSGADGGSAIGTFTARLDRGAATVVLVSGPGDGSVPSLRLIRVVSNAIDVVHQRVPHARILVLGPMDAATALPADLVRVRSVLRSSTRAAGGTFVDPTQQQWFAGGTGMSADGARLTPAGQERLASGLSTLLAS